MGRLSYCAMLAAGVAALLQSPVAQADSVRPRSAPYRHYREATDVHPYRAARVVFVYSPFYGQFGGYEDTFWASHYPGPAARRYYGYGWDPRLRF